MLLFLLKMRSVSLTCLSSLIRAWNRASFDGLPFSISFLHPCSIFGCSPLSHPCLYHLKFPDCHPTATQHPRLSRSAQKILRWQPSSPLQLHRRQIQLFPGGFACIDLRSVSFIGRGGSLVYGRPKLQASRTPRRIEGNIMKLRAKSERFMKIAERGAVGFASKGHH